MMRIFVYVKITNYKGDHSLHENYNKTEFFLVRTEKYGPEKTPHLDTFHAVIHIVRSQIFGKTNISYPLIILEKKLYCDSKFLLEIRLTVCR